MNDNYVTSLSYLKLAVKPRYPKFMKKYVKFFMKYGSIPLVKILSVILGLGMGLGLSLVSKIISSFNGKIWVKEKIKGDYRKGSNFIIELLIKKKCIIAAFN